jgi:hypothetical protein
VKITIESTSRTILVKTSALSDGMLCRVWEGETASGIKVMALIPRISPNGKDQDISQFEAELIEQRAPSAEVAAIPLRLIL